MSAHHCILLDAQYHGYYPLIGLWPNRFNEYTPSSMQWTEIKITFTCDNIALGFELIADLLHSLGNRGVIVDDPHLEPLEPWGQDAVSRPCTPAVTGYLPVHERFEQKRLNLEQALRQLASAQAIDYTVTYRRIDEDDWAEAWKAFFWPEEIAPSIVVKPTWRDYEPSFGQLVLEIDPGMAFGTGTHPTTAMCIQLLQRYVQPNQSVLDVGTGSGILLIAASKLGANRLTGIDVDPVAIDIARQNLIQNKIDPDAVQLHCADLLDSELQPHDMVVANILTEVIVELLDHIGKVLHHGGIFICSGIIEALRSEVTEKLVHGGFDLLDMEQQGDWVALVGRLN